MGRTDYEMIKLLDYAVQEVSLAATQENPFAIVIFAHLQALKTRKDPEQLLQSKLAITRALYQRGFSKDYIIKLYHFLDWIMVLPPPLELLYNETLEQLEEEQHVTYITSIERRGIQKGIDMILLHQLQHRFGSLPISYQEKLRSANSDQLMRWGEQLLEARTLQDVFAEEFDYETSS